jgi:hypothetical protein
MSVVDGYNPLRWDCEQNGCFNKLRRPKIETFARCLPRRLAFMDVDATTELNGRFLFIEWKSADPELGTGQRIYFENLTRLSNRMTAVVVSGNAETMEVRAIQVIKKGKRSEWEIINLEGLKARITAWAMRCGGATVEAV